MAKKVVFKTTVLESLQRGAILLLDRDRVSDKASPTDISISRRFSLARVRFITKLLLTYSGRVHVIW